MKLSLVIPYYNTPAELVDRLFKSINDQPRFDFKELEILFVDDCSPIKYDFNRIAQFDNLADIVKVVPAKQNGGPGVARQYGLHYAEGEYVIFADSDDRFLTVHKETIKVKDKEGREITEEKEYGVFEFFLELIKAYPDANIIRTSWLEEQHKDEVNKIIYFPHLAQLDNTWLHGKLFKRKFIVDNDIHFHPLLRGQEDSYFNSIAAEIAGKSVIAYNPLLSYVWCDDHKESITRARDCLYSFSGMEEFINAIDYAIDWLNKLKRDDINIVGKVVNNLIYIYWMLQTPAWREQKRRKYYKRVLKRLAQFEKKYRDVWNYISIDDAEFAKMYMERYNIEFECNKFIPQETFKHFLNRVRKLAS